MKPLQIEVFTAPGCGKCGQAKTRLKRVVEELKLDGIAWREVNILEELDYAVDLGVLSTPAIAMNGKLVFVGLPSEKAMLKKVSELLGEAPA